MSAIECRMCSRLSRIVTLDTHPLSLLHQVLVGSTQLYTPKEFLDLLSTLTPP